MTKYKPDFKAKIVHEYLTTPQSSRAMGRKYSISSRLIKKWIQRYRLSGIDALKRHRHPRTLTADFKLSVIDYYQTHEELMVKVAARFDVQAYQISLWRSQFKRDGIEALKPHPKGRPSKVKHTNKTEVERLKEELAKKSQELYDTKLERDILKKSLALFGPSKAKRKRK